MYIDEMERKSYYANEEQENLNEDYRDFDEVMKCVQTTLADDVHENNLKVTRKMGF